MDIVVTIPKSEYQNDDKETAALLTDPNAFQFWVLKREPKRLCIGDRVYFIKNNKVESSMKVFNKNWSKNHCDVTNRDWEGFVLYLNDLEFLKSPIPAKGFQGFRYKWW
jgi:hypothetical protein